MAFTHSACLSWHARDLELVLLAPLVGGVHRLVLAVVAEVDEAALLLHRHAGVKLGGQLLGNVGGNAYQKGILCGIVMQWVTDIIFSFWHRQ